MATVTEPQTRASLVFDDVTWDDYEAMLRIVGERPFRVTYDDGRMEVMSSLLKHGGASYLLGRFIDVLTEEWDVPVEAGDPVTFNRRDIGKGVEPDKCYFLGPNAALVRGKDRLVMGEDPPPDLVIEADITHSSLDRLKIYAALSIAEVWRFDGETLEFFHLQSDKTYRSQEASLNFPGLLVEATERFLERAQNEDKTAWVRSIRAYLRKIPRNPGPA